MYIQPLYLMYIQPLYLYTITTNIYTHYNIYIYTITLTIYSKPYSCLVDIHFAGTNFQKSATEILEIQLHNLPHEITTELTGRLFRKSACYLIYYTRWQESWHVRICTVNAKGVFHLLCSKFSKVSSLVFLCSKFSRELTFENLYPPDARFACGEDLRVERERERERDR